LLAAGYLHAGAFLLLPHGGPEPRWVLSRDASGRWSRRNQWVPRGAPQDRRCALRRRCSRLAIGIAV